MRHDQPRCLRHVLDAGGSAPFRQNSTDHTRRKETATLLVLAVLSWTGCSDTSPAEPYTCDHPPEDMICVPAGEFMMGAHITLIPSPNFARTIYLPDFAIDRDEVTVGQYQSCITDGPCTSATTDSQGNPCNASKTSRDDHPVDCTDWEQADTYCTWQGKRLPTEAEWEKAAGGTDGRKYPWGNEPPDCENSVIGGWQDDSLDGCNLVTTTAPVGSRSPAGDSPYGVRDMQGNVFEWCFDWYAPYDANDTDDPQGPPTGVEKSVRGAAYDTGLDDAAMITVSFREGHHPTRSSDGQGFRCATDLEGEGTDED